MKDEENKTSSVGYDGDEKTKIDDLVYASKYGTTDAFQLDESGGVAGVTSFEDLLEMIGTFGRWNITIFVVGSMCACMIAFQGITYQFLGATPEYWCHVDALVDANWTRQEIFNLAIPSKNGSDIDGCNYNNYNYTLAAEMGYEQAMLNIDKISIGNGSVITCPSRDFNTSQYKSTVTTEFDLVCERRALYSTTQSVSQGGVLIGACVFGFLLDKFGRRPIILLSVLCSVICGLGAAVSPLFEIYILFKTLTSAFNFGAYTGCFVAVLELCSPSQRSSIGNLFVMPWAFGYMIVPGIAYIIREWRWLQTAYSLPMILLFSYYWLLPESPRWLISEGRYEEAAKVLAKAAKVNKRVLPPQQALIISMQAMTPPKEEKPRKKLSRRIYVTMKHFLILLVKSDTRVKALICFFCWASVSMVYYGVSLNSENLGTDPYLYVFLGGLTEVPSYLLLWPMMEYLGRKISLVSLYLLCAFTIAIIAVLLAVQDEVSSGVMMFLSLSGKMAITAAFHLVYIFTAELFPTKYRSLAVGQSSMVARVGSIASPYINDILGDTISWGPSTLFASVSVLAAVLSLVLPETKGADLTEDKATDKKAEHHQNGIQMDQGQHNVAFEPN